MRQLAIHTTGDVVTEAQGLGGHRTHGAEVTAEVTPDNKDIGFVSPTQETTIKLVTFSYLCYGR